MHCHDVGIKIDIPDGARKIVLAGNPNVGKSVFFNAFTGLYVDVSNYPGTTLEISHGRYNSDVVIDTPGVYGISSFNDEEKIARDIILGADIVVNIVDAVHLERDLFLTQQVIDTGAPVVIALNMLDEAEHQGRRIDVDLLGDLLGVPVVPTVATKKQGINELKAAIEKARSGHIDPGLHKKLHLLHDRVGNQGEALLILEGDPIVAQRHGIEPGADREEIYLQRRARVNDIIGHVVTQSRNGAGLGSVLGRLMIQPLTGLPILAVFLYGMYKFIGVFIAGDVVGLTEEVVMQGYYEPWMRSLVGRFVSEQSWLGTILIGEFGVLTMTVTYILGLLLPLVFGFYLALSTFEDSGYLPRIATLSDRAMTGIGLNGRAIIPIILGFGCVTLATITTRLLGSDRERKIAVFLLGLAIPCSAQLAVIAGLLSKVSGLYMTLFVLVIFTVLATAGTLLDRVLPGRSTDLLIDLPPLRLPRIDNVMKKTMTKSYHFLVEATPLFAGGALLIGILQVTGLLVVLQKLLQPLTVGWLGLPKEAATAFIMGFVRRDFGAAGLATMQLTEIQTIVGLITITLFVPCIASTLIIFKERGRKEGLLVWPAILGLAFIIGGLTAQTYRLTGSAEAVIGVVLAFLVLIMLFGKYISSKSISFKEGKAPRQVEQ